MKTQCSVLIILAALAGTIFLPPAAQAARSTSQPGDGAKPRLEVGRQHDRRAKTLALKKKSNQPGLAKAKAKTGSPETRVINKQAVAKPEQARRKLAGRVALAVHIMIGVSSLALMIFGGENGSSLGMGAFFINGMFSPLSALIFGEDDGDVAGAKGQAAATPGEAAARP